MPSSVFLIRSTEVGWTEVHATVAYMEDAHIVGETTSVAQTERAIATLPHQPDLILTAAKVAEGSVLPLLHALREGACPTSRIVVFAADFEADALLALAEIGDVSCLRWRDLCCDSLPHCLSVLIASEVIISSRVAVTTFTDTLRASPRDNNIVVPLNLRERAVLKRLAEGLTREQIGRAEGMSLRTVNRTVSEMEKKLGAQNSFVLGARAALHGLVLTGESGITTPFTGAEDAKRMT